MFSHKDEFAYEVDFLCVSEDVLVAQVQQR